MPTGGPKQFRIENHLPQPIFIEVWRKKSKDKVILRIRAYLKRPTSAYMVRRIRTEQALVIILNGPTGFDFTSHLGRNVMGEVRKTDYGHLINFDFFTEGAN